MTKTAKMTKVQRTYVFQAVAERPGLHPTYCDGSIATGSRWRSFEPMHRNGWIDAAGRETFKGLIAAGVDMDAIHAEALEIHEEIVRRFLVEVRRGIAEGTTPVQELRDAVHAEALEDDITWQMQQMANRILLQVFNLCAHGLHLDDLCPRCDVDEDHAEAARYSRSGESHEGHEDPLVDDWKDPEEDSGMMFIGADGRLVNPEAAPTGGAA